MRSPNWKEEELKLALELYLSKDLEWLAKMSDSTKEIQGLSQLLNHMNLFPDPKPDRFRSCGSIRMKLSNFKALDNRYGKSSLSNVGSSDKKIWNRYHGNYETLLKECKKIVNDHFEGARDGVLGEYLERYEHSVDVNQISDFYAFADKTYRLAKEYQKKAIAGNNEELSRKIEETCNELMKVLEGSKTEKKENPEIQEHGGINQAPIKSKKTKSRQRTKDTNNREDKIGQHVQDTMKKLISEGLITKGVLNKLLDTSWSKRNLHLSHPFVIKIDSTTEIKEQLRDSNGYLRYWKEVHVINDGQYCFCKEWFESGRKYFDAWVKSLTQKAKLGISEEQLLKLVQFIKVEDEKSISIKRDALFSKMGRISNKEKLLRSLISIGLLTGFQGTEREFVVDDYDVMFDMLTHPERYC